VSDCTLWRMSWGWFLRLVQTNLELCFAMSMQLATQFQAYMDRIDNLEYKKADERVAYRLLFLASRFGIKADNVITIDVPITHELLAQSVNLTRETVSRHVEILVSKDIISHINHRFAIKDLDGLTSRLSRPPNFKSWHLD